jgi:hypothetical protein
VPIVLAGAAAVFEPVFERTKVGAFDANWLRSIVGLGRTSFSIPFGVIRAWNS